MQQENEFEKIISTWRRRTERYTHSYYPSMHKDLSDKPYKEDVDLVPVKCKAPGAGVHTESVHEDHMKKVEMHNHSDIEETKEAAGDSCSKDGNECAENYDKLPNDNKWLYDKQADKVDSVFLRSPPPDKTRSTASSAEEKEECCVTCLYYTLQCFDCTIM